ncbi:MAG: TerC family protein [Legionellaceae bacterium]|nr:TerC family protein [Legionellaceae bacterium]
MDLLDIGLSVLTLTVLEIILGIDNLVFLTILTEKLPAAQRKRARRWGLSFAWITRLILLASAVWIVQLKQPIITFHEFSFSIRDLFLFLGGAFLITKATQEIHYELVDKDDELRDSQSPVSITFRGVVTQVALMDIIFSLDSVLTAIGLTNHYIVMVVAITIAILIMIYASHAVGSFIEKHPTIKMLALSFLILIGTLLIADSFSFHIPRGYLYFAMGFSLGVEALNLLKRDRLRAKLRRKKK